MVTTRAPAGAAPKTPAGTGNGKQKATDSQREPSLTTSAANTGGGLDSSGWLQDDGMTVGLPRATVQQIDTPDDQVEDLTDNVDRIEDNLAATRDAVTATQESVNATKASVEGPSARVSSTTDEVRQLTQVVQQLVA